MYAHVSYSTYINYNVENIIIKAHILVNNNYIHELTQTCVYNHTMTCVRNKEANSKHVAHITQAGKSLQ